MSGYDRGCILKNIYLLGDRDAGAITHRELDAAIRLLPDGVRARWVGTDTPDALRTAEADGLWAVSGTPYRNDAAVYAAIKTARTSGQPFLGTCGGFQYAVVEFARNVAGIAGAEHAETAPDADQRVVDRLACSLVGQERSVTAIPGTHSPAYVLFASRDGRGPSEGYPGTRWTQGSEDATALQASQSGGDRGRNPTPRCVENQRRAWQHNGNVMYRDHELLSVE
jgi:hypothetical protein